MSEEIYVGLNKTLDEWLEANPNLANLHLPDLLVNIPIKEYPFGWVEVTDKEPF